MAFSTFLEKQPWTMDLLPFPLRAAMVNASSPLPLESSHGQWGLHFSSALGKASMVFFTSLGKQPWTMDLLPFPWRAAMVNASSTIPLESSHGQWGLHFSSSLGKASMVCTSLGEQPWTKMGLHFSSALGKASMVCTSLGKQPWTMGVLFSPVLGKAPMVFSSSFREQPWTMDHLPFPWRAAMVNGSSLQLCPGEAFHDLHFPWRAAMDNGSSPLPLESSYGQWVFSSALSWGRLPWSALSLESSHGQWVFTSALPWGRLPWSSPLPLESSHGQWVFTSALPWGRLPWSSPLPLESSHGQWVFTSALSWGRLPWSSPLPLESNHGQWVFSPSL